MGELWKLVWGKPEVDPRSLAEAVRSPAASLWLCNQLLVAGRNSLRSASLSFFATR